jgi:hypothetical protein
MRRSEEATARRAKMIEHLEAALALAGETGETIVSFIIEQALDQARGSMRPGSLD